MARLTIKDIAQLAGVSAITVSRVINRKPDVAAATVERVEAVISAHNWLPNLQARGLVRGRTYTLGFVTSGVASSFTGELLQAAEQAAAAERYGLLLVATGADQERARQGLAMLLQRGVDGIVLSGPLPLADAQLAPALEAGVPLVSLYVRRQRVPTLTTDYAAAGRLAAAELRRLGHRHALYVHDSEPLARDAFTLARWTGFQVGGGADFQAESLRQAYGETQPLVARLRQGGVTAVFCQNDRCLPDVYRAAWEMGLRIPRDLSVIGCNDEPVCRHLVPRATSVSVGSTRLAADAVRLLLAHDPARPARGRTYQPVLVPRESMAASGNL